VPPGALEAEQAAVLESKPVQAVAKKQKDTGLWGNNLLGLEPDADAGIKDVGTIPQYRRLLQLGVPAGARPLRLADRVLYRVLSRDEDPALYFEWTKTLKAAPALRDYARGVMREAVSAALAEAGHLDDPRVRGAGHKIADQVSAFLRGPIVESPFVKAGRGLALHPEAHPPSWYSVAMIAAMPNLRRERAGFAERLGHYLAQPAPKKSFVIQIEGEAMAPSHLLLGDPIEVDAKSCPKDIPLALHYIELLARMGALQWAPVASRALARLLKDCDEQGVWHPKGIRSWPSAHDPFTYHAYPLQQDDKKSESKLVDVTFRLASIAKLLGWDLEYV